MRERERDRAKMCAKNWSRTFFIFSWLAVAECDRVAWLACCFRKRFKSEGEGQIGVTRTVSGRSQQDSDEELTVNVLPPWPSFRQFHFSYSYLFLLQFSFLPFSSLPYTKSLIIISLTLLLLLLLLSLLLLLLLLLSSFCLSLNLYIYYYYDCRIILWPWQFYIHCVYVYDEYYIVYYIIHIIPGSIFSCTCVYM